MNYLVPPILYEGSCFNDIVDGLIKSAYKNKIQLEVPAIKKGFLNNNGFDNPREYFIDSINKLKSLAEKLKTGDTILFVDFYCPGLDLLEYYLTRSKIKVQKIALMHGASFVDGDIFSEYKWMENFEKGWIDIYDKIICPSEFFLNNLKNVDKSKFMIIPWGIDESITSNLSDKKRFDVIFPHRLAEDKGIEDFISIVKLLPNLKFCITGINKKAILKGSHSIKKYLKDIDKLKNVTIIETEKPMQHLMTLKSSKVVLSTALQEGFGYAVMKSIQSGNIPVLPNRCCYKEYYLSKYRYSSIMEAVQLIKKFTENYPKDYFVPDYSKYSFDNIIKLLK